MNVALGDINGWPGETWDTENWAREDGWIGGWVCEWVGGVGGWAGAWVGAWEDGRLF